MSIAQVTALVVDSDPESRMRLKQAITAVGSYKTALVKSSFAQCLEHLNQKGTDILVVFLSSRFPREAVSEFIDLAKQTPGGIDSAYVEVLPKKDQDVAKVATSMIKGLDSFLFEPYSVDALIDITKLAISIKGKRVAERQSKALRFLIKDIAFHIDCVSRHLGLKGAMGEGIKDLRNSTKAIANLTAEGFDTYIELLIDEFGNLPAPKVKTHKSEEALKRLKAKLSPKSADIMDAPENDTRRIIKKR